MLLPQTAHLPCPELVSHTQRKAGITSPPTTAPAHPRPRQRSNRLERIYETCLILELYTEICVDFGQSSMTGDKTQTLPTL